MTIKEILNKISESVLTNFQRHGFKYLKTQGGFIKKTDVADQIPDHADL